MFCAGCGQPIQSQQAVCAHCGRPVVQTFAPAWPVERVRRHLQTMGILWIVWAAWTMLSWLIALPFVMTALGAHTSWTNGWGGPPHFGAGFPFAGLSWLPTVITVVVVVRATLAVVTGIALLRRAPWARTLALVTAFLTLIKPITGTILAIYTLWVLLPGRSGEEYRQIAAY